MRVPTLLPLSPVVSLALLALPSCLLSQRLRFSEPRPIHYSSTGNYIPVSVTPGDLNGDGNTDLLVYSETPKDAPVFATQLELLTGDGDGGFTSTVLPIVPKPSSKFLIADVNGDGNQDILVFHGGDEQGPNPYEGAFEVYLGDGQGNFQLKASYGQPAGVATATVIGDFNHDGMPDVAVLVVNTQAGSPDNTASYLSIFINTGGGTFFQTQQVDDFQEYDKLGPIGDYSGDGNNDLILISSSTNSFRVLDGQGDGTYLDPGKATYTFDRGSIVDMVSANLTEDDRTDLVVSLVPRDRNAVNTKIVTLLAMQDGGFRRYRDIELPCSFDLIQMADLNGDGIPDLFWLDELGSGVGAMLGKGDARFGEPREIARGDWRSMAAAPLRTGALPSIFVLGRNDDDRSYYRQRHDSNLAVIVNETR